MCNGNEKRSERKKRNLRNERKERQKERARVKPVQSNVQSVKPCYRHEWEKKRWKQRSVWVVLRTQTERCEQRANR